MKMKNFLLTFSVLLIIAGCGNGGTDGDQAGGARSVSLPQGDVSGSPPTDSWITEDAGVKNRQGDNLALQRAGGPLPFSAGDPDCGGLPTGDPACGAGEVVVEEKDYIYPEGWNEDEMYKNSYAPTEDYSGGELEDEKYTEIPEELSEEERAEMYAPPTPEQDCEYLAPGDPDYCTKCGGC